MPKSYNTVALHYSCVYKVVSHVIKLVFLKGDKCYLHHIISMLLFCLLTVIAFSVFKLLAGRASDLYKILLYLFPDVYLESLGDRWIMLVERGH